MCDQSHMYCSVLTLKTVGEMPYMTIYNVYVVVIKTGNKLSVYISHSLTYCMHTKFKFYESLFYTFLSFYFHIILFTYIYGMNTHTHNTMYASTHKVYTLPMESTVDRYVCMHACVSVRVCVRALYIYKFLWDISFKNFMDDTI